MKRPWSRPRPNDEIGMTAMIDVVFLLLVFFLWTSRFDEPERDLAAGLSMSEAATAGGSERRMIEPPPPDSTPDLVDELIVQINGHGPSRRWSIGEATVQRIDELRQRLGQIAAIGVQPPVIVEPATDIAIEDVIATFDVARQVGFRRVYLGVSP